MKGSMHCSGNNVSKTSTDRRNVSMKICCSDMSRVHVDHADIPRPCPEGSTLPLGCRRMRERTRMDAACAGGRSRESYRG